MVRLTRDPARLSALAAVFGRAFVREPMMRWPLGSEGDIEERFTRCFAYFLEAALPLGLTRRSPHGSWTRSRWRPNCTDAASEGR